MEHTITNDAKNLRELKIARDEAKAAFEALDKDYKSREAAFIERLQQEDVDSIKVDGINFVPSETIYGQVQDRSAFVEWAKVHAPELIEDRERKQLVNGLVREHLDNGEVMPPGLSFYVKEYVSLRAA